MNAPANGLTVIPPELVAELAAVMVKLARTAARAELAAAKDTAGEDDRVRHDRTALPRRPILDAIRAEQLPAVKIGKYWYIRRADLAAFYEAHDTSAQHHQGDAIEDDFDRAMRRAGLRKGATNDTPAPRRAAGRGRP